MGNKEALQLFGEKRIRTAWNQEEEKWYFSIVDVVAALTDSVDYQSARNYWKVLKKRLKDEGNETVTNCNRLKLFAADGKMRLTDVADQQQLFRLIQSIPSPKAEPFKQWIAEVSTKAISQARQPDSFSESKQIAREGGTIAGDARENIEKRVGGTVISALNAKDKPALDTGTQPPEIQ